MCVMARDIIPLRPQPLDEGFLGPALESESAGFDTLHEGVAGQERFVGFADLVVGTFDAGVENGGGLPEGVAVAVGKRVLC